MENSGKIEALSAGLREVLVEAGVVNPNMTLDGVELLMAASTYAEHLRNTQARLEFVKESKAFEIYAIKHKLSLEQHPLHYLFLDPVTNAHRQCWKAAIQYAQTGE